MTVSAAHFWTGVYIDGVENTDFRSITGHHDHHSNTATEFVWMQPGKHFVQVQYDTSGNYAMNN